jgi:hypothetical protein
MKATYEAAWLPFVDQAEGVDPTVMAVGYVERLCDERGVDGVLVTYLRRDAATPSLARFAAKHLHVTQRSGGSSQGGAAVLVDMPNARLLEVAHRCADGGALCAIEGGPFTLSGWAAATDAINLVTGRRPEPLPDHVVKALDALHWGGQQWMA